MKNHFILFFFILVEVTTLNAQLPLNPEDISPLLCGEQLPDAVLEDPNGLKRSFREIIKQKPSVVIFYRGGWYPYCNTHLSDIQTVEDEILNLVFI